METRNEKNNRSGATAGEETLNCSFDMKEIMSRRKKEPRHFRVLRRKLIIAILWTVVLVAGLVVLVKLSLQSWQLAAVVGIMVALLVGCVCQWVRVRVERRANPLTLQVFDFMERLDRVDSVNSYTKSTFSWAVVPLLVLCIPATFITQQATSSLAPAPAVIAESNSVAAPQQAVDTVIAPRQTQHSTQVNTNITVATVLPAPATTAPATTAPATTAPTTTAPATTAPATIVPATTSPCTVGAAHSKPITATSSSKAIHQTHTDVHTRDVVEASAPDKDSVGDIKTTDELQEMQRMLRTRNNTTVPTALPIAQERNEKSSSAEAHPNTRVRKGLMTSKPIKSKLGVH